MKRKKYDDKLTREVYSQYNLCTAHKRRLEIKKKFNGLNEEEQQDLIKCDCYIETVDAIVENVLSPTQMDIIERIFIYKEPLADISECLHHGYYYISELKVQACKKLDKIWNDEEIFKNYIGKTFDKHIIKMLEKKNL